MTKKENEKLIILEKEIQNIKSIIEINFSNINESMIRTQEINEKEHNEIKDAIRKIEKDNKQTEKINGTQNVDISKIDTKLKFYDKVLLSIVVSIVIMIIKMIITTL